jgi:hypothetical protein
LAASWGTPVLVAQTTRLGAPYAGALLALGEGAAAALYGVSDIDVAKTFVRTTTDSGRTWSHAVLVSDHGWTPVIAGHGSHLGVAWAWNERIWYRRSTDGGRSFEHEIALSPANLYAHDVALAHGADGSVAAVWQQAGQIVAASSIDDGASFASPRIVAPEGVTPRVAVGGGAVTVAYSTPSSAQLVVAVSRDLGTSWATTLVWPMRIGDYEEPSYSIVGDDDMVVVAYGVLSAYSTRRPGIRYRRSVDDGASWSPVRLVQPPASSATNVHLSLDSGVLAAVYDRCRDSRCDAVFYRRSRDGLHWSPAVRVSPTEFSSYARSVAFAGAVVVMYNGFPPPDYTKSIFVRTQVP